MALKYAVINFTPHYEASEEVILYGPYLSTIDQGIHFSDIQEAEKFRHERLKNDSNLEPQNLQIIQYKIGDLYAFD